MRSNIPRRLVVAVAITSAKEIGYRRCGAKRGERLRSLAVR
jgi:hypothetical protein